MKNKYNFDVIYNYVNGLDTGFDEAELENDFEFMKKVIDFTNDKKMYNFCSDELKADPNFAVYLIDKFPDDLDFIRKVFSNCVDNYDEAEEDKEQTPEAQEKSKGIFELYVLLYNKYIKDENLRLKLALLINANCVFLNVRISAILNNDELKPQVKELLQMGFAILVSEYGKHEHLMKYFANKYIDDIFETNKIDLEVLLHEKFTTYQEFEKYGVNRYLIELLSNYDSYLGDYIANHVDILDRFNNLLFNVKFRWHGYIKNKQRKLEEEKEQYRRAFRIIEYAMKDTYDHIDFYPYYKIVGQKLGLWDKIKKYHNYENRNENDTYEINQYILEYFEEFATDLEIAEYGLENVLIDDKYEDEEDKEENDTKCNFHDITKKRTHK